MFTAESGGLVTCVADSAETRDEKAVFKVFREEFGEDARLLTDQAKVLFKVTVEDGSKTKPVIYTGVAHTAKFSEVLELFNQKYSKGLGQEGAFLLKAGAASMLQKSGRGGTRAPARGLL